MPPATVQQHRKIVREWRACASSYCPAYMSLQLPFRNTMRSFANGVHVPPATDVQCYALRNTVWLLGSVSEGVHVPPATVQQHRTVVTERRTYTSSFCPATPCHVGMMAKGGAGYPIAHCALCCHEPAHGLGLGQLAHFKPHNGTVMTNTMTMRGSANAVLNAAADDAEHDIVSQGPRGSISSWHWQWQSYDMMSESSSLQLSSNPCRCLPEGSSCREDDPLLAIS
jgi:hypothetical protein